MLTVDDKIASGEVDGEAGPDGRPHAIVIGSGFGGLAAAVRLGARGYRVSVLEKLDKPGGRAYVFEQDGFVFDAGPTVITAPFVFNELWQLAGKRLEDDLDMRPIYPFYRIRFHDGRTFDYSGDTERVVDEIQKFCPGDVAGYARYLEASKRAYETGFDKLIHAPFHSLGFMLKQLPSLLQIDALRSVHGQVSRYFKDPNVRTVFSFHPLLIGGHPFRTTAVYCLISHLEKSYGVHFPMGGTGAIVRGIVGLIEGQGGQVLCNQEVREILVDGGRASGVRLASGDTMHADIVVSNADPAWVYKHLLPGVKRRRWTDRKIDRAKFSMGLFVWYFGTKRRYEDVAHHSILLGPRYEGLLDDIFKSLKLSDDFSLYLHRPTATDPSLAPDGCDGFYVLSCVPNLKSGHDWAVEGERYRRKIEAYLGSTVLPGLKDEIISSRFVTPADFESRLLSVNGAAFGLEPLLTQSAWFRPHNKSEEVDGLYMVGAGTHPGAGLPGVVSSARVLDALVPDASAIRN